MKATSLLAGALWVLAWGALSRAGDCDFGVKVDDAEGMEGGTATVRVVLDFDADEDGGEDIQGWSVGICHDPAILSVTDTEIGADTAVVKDGDPPDFRRINIESNGAQGVTQGIVIDFGMTGTMITLPPRNDFESLIITYTIETGPADCPEDPGTPLPPCLETALTVCNDLGTPPIVTVMVVGGRSIPFCPGASKDGTIRICCPPPAPAFIRGDSNVDQRVDMGDGIFVLNWLFQGGEVPACMDAADINDDGEVDSSDAVYNFQWQFLDGPEPAAPWPACGIDPEDPADDLDCADYVCP